MSVELSFQVPDEIAEEIVEDIEDTVSSSSEDWEFRGSFTIPEAIKIKNDLEARLSDQ